jgi:hypothetical protein
MPTPWGAESFSGKLRILLYDLALLDPNML